MSEQKLTDNSSDKKYFVITPQIVWGLSRDVYDKSLWDTVKMITGEHGECWASTSTLAKLSMMSEGKVSECRSYLISTGLLQGETKNVNDSGQKVWHLTIPDLWEKNIAWRKVLGNSLGDRAKYKDRQRKDVRAKRKSERSKKSLHHMKPSSYEGKPSPYETKKNPKEKPSTTTTCESTILHFEELYGSLKGTKNERIRQDFSNTIKEYSSEWVSLALDRAWIDRKDGPDWSPSWGYVKAILKNWQKAGGLDNENKNRSNTNGKNKPNSNKTKSKKPKTRTDDTSAEILRELEKHGIDPATVGM